MIKIFKSYNELDTNIIVRLKKANIFYSEEYYNYVLETGTSVFYLSDGAYIIPCSLKKQLIFSFGTYLSEPYCIIPEDNNSDARKIFINEVQCYIKSNKIWDWQNVVGAYTMFDVYPDTSQRIRFGNLVIDLSLENDVLLGNMTAKHRNMARRAEKDGVLIKIGGVELLDDYCYLDAQTWERSGREGVNKDYYKKILLRLKEKAFIAISYANGTPQTGMLSYYNNSMMYYMYGASCRRPAIGTNNYLHWEVIKEMKRRGVEKYSFVGYRINVDAETKLAGIQHFKKGFGGDLCEGYLFKETINPFKKKLYDLLMFVYASFKNIQIVDDVIDQEITKWSEINN